MTPAINEACICEGGGEWGEGGGGGFLVLEIVFFATEQNSCPM